MVIFRVIPRRIFFILFTLLFVGCGREEANVVTGKRLGILHYGNGSEPQGLDPHVVTGVPELSLIHI